MVKCKTLLKELHAGDIFMPFDASKLAYASNDAGNGDLNCLAHLLVAHIKEKKLIQAGFFQLYQAYLLKNSLTPNNLEQKKFLEMIGEFTPLEVEQEITPVLEGLLNTIATGSGKNTKLRLKKFVALANSFGLKVEIYAAKNRPGTNVNFAQQYADFRPSKDVNRPRVNNLQEVIKKDPTKVINVVPELGIDQTAFDDDDKFPTIKLFLEDFAGDGCNCCFEHPADGKSDSETLELHNGWIQSERERRQARSSKSGAERPLSFMDSIGGLISMLGGIFTTFMQVFLGAVQKFQPAFVEPPSRSSGTSFSDDILSKSKVFNSFGSGDEDDDSEELESKRVKDRPESPSIDPLLPSGGPRRSKHKSPSSSSDTTDTTEDEPSNSKPLQLETSSNRNSWWRPWWG